MPYGLPSAVTLRKDCKAIFADFSRSATLPAGMHLEILHPGADQDGYNDEWVCRDMDSGIKFAVKTKFLKNNKA